MSNKIDRLLLQSYISELVSNMQKMQFSNFFFQGSNKENKTKHVMVLNMLDTQYLHWFLGLT